MASVPTSASTHRLQHMLQSAVQAVQWTYSLFWQVCPQQGILVWEDGYYNGAIKTRKTIQPVEVSTEEASLQRSQQLRELYESLSAEETNQPARRPCAALSPEDLTESEWFYLMSVSFSFPPGVGLPGKAFARQQHVWLTGANDTDSKIFTRAILAKSARVQTVICIPLANGVIELGTTERVKEDLGLIQYVKSFFTDYHHPYPKPALSEHSTSNPAASDLHFQSPPGQLLAMYTATHPISRTNQEEEEEDDEEEEDEDDEEDEESGSDSQTGTGHNGYPITSQEPNRLCDPITTNEVTMAQAAAMAEPSELVQLEMSEDIRLGSPDDGSNNLDSDIHMFNVEQTDHQQRPDPSCRWSTFQNPLCDGFQLPASEAPQTEELTQEDTHYSQTVSTILQQNSGRWPEYSSSGYVGYSTQSAFGKWSNRNDHLLHLPSDGSSQFTLKYILFHVPFLHNKYRDENLPKSRDSTTDASNRLRKGVSQEDLSANHVLAERRRREKLNERFIILRSLVPFVTKMDKASILGDTIEYVKQLRKRIQDLEARNRSTETGDKKSKSGGEVQKIGAFTRELRNMVHGSESGVMGIDSVALPGPDKRKLRIVERSGGEKTKVVEGLPIGGNVVQVSIIESDALLELKCVYREGLLLEIMQILRELRLEITAVQSSSTNGIFVAELRAKVKENNNGKKVTIMEVKRAIHQSLSHF